jgi:hypothetical protein
MRTALSVAWLLLYSFAGNRSEEQEDGAMEHRKAPSIPMALVICLGLGIAALTVSQPAHAGGLRLSIGIGIPAPVYVAPVPVVVAPAPVLIYPPPAVVYQYPVVVTRPYFVHKHHFPPGLAKKYYGYHPAHSYKFYKPGKRRW